jgi:hypothetical protein
MIDVIQINPENRYFRDLFLNLPFKLYKETPQWVPPLIIDAKRMLDPKHNPFFEHGQAAFFLALDAQHNPLARVAALKNDNYNEFNHEKTAFFYLFESINRPEVSLALFELVFSWASAQNLNKVIGPKGFSVLDGLGMLVDGFEHRPAFGLPYNPPYYPSLIESSGFVSSGEMVSGYLSAKSAFPEKIHQVSELVQRRRGLHVLSFKNRLEFMKYIPMLQKLYNSSLEGTTGNIPLTQNDIKTLANQLLWFADPRLIKIIVKDEEPVGFLLAYPDISEAVQRCKGRLLPFGWLLLLLEIKKARWVNINGAAIVEKYRGMGGTAILFSEMHKSLKKGKFNHADLVQIGIDNERMQLELRNLGIDFYKTHRLYQRNL